MILLRIFYHYVSEVLFRGLGEGHTFMRGRLCLRGIDLVLIFLALCVLRYYWGCARGFGRGTLYMKWGQ